MANFQFHFFRWWSQTVDRVTLTRCAWALKLPFIKYKKGLIEVEPIFGLPAEERKKEIEEGAIDFFLLFS